ncbi:MAG: glycosyltransferase family 2 protein [Chloroflexi bacterium]|nr:glycosyltransferase family 2 protein [Chloroflexota bacterium]
MKLSVLIPVYNEEDHIRELLERVAAVPVEKELVVVDDHSTDGTAEILRSMQLPNMQVIRHERNLGKGSAVRTALAAATGDAVIIQDADLEYYPEDYPRLLEPMIKEGVKVVYGVRTLSNQSLLRRLGNHFLTFVTNLLYGTRLKDMETCYKLVSRGLIQSFTIKSNRFDMEPEITAKILKRGQRIRQVPISYSPRVVRKLSPWRDGWPALWALIKYRFVD